MKRYEFSFQDIVEAAKDIVIVTKADSIDKPGTEIVYVNNAFTQLTGYTFKEAVGKNPRILQSTGTDEATINKIHSALIKKQPIRATLKNYTKSGKEFWLDLSISPLKNNRGEVTHFVAIERDVTEQKNLEIKLEKLSKTDSLTKLLNRRAFNDIINTELLRYKRAGSIFSVLMLDIDHFKSINDTFGHPIGDKVLEEIGVIFNAILRTQDSAARIGGEEFCILLPDTSLKIALTTANRIKDVIAATSIFTKKSPIKITVSIGISEINKLDTNYSSILARADKALYQAKSSGRNRVCEYKT